MVSAPDVRGLLAELARLSECPEQRARYRAASAVHVAAGQMRRGARYRTRSLPRAFAIPRRPQPRDPVTGRFVRAS